MPVRRIISEPDNFYELRYAPLIVAGVDEAGRGPLAGPVVAAAVILPRDFENNIGINDSKKLCQSQRDILYDKICEIALGIGTGIADWERIDEINILHASQEAMRKAVLALGARPEFLLVDGNYFMDFGIPYKTIVKGDSKSVSIAAASIVAKVTRDRWMTEIAHRDYPVYSFDSHKGYGTRKHYEAIEKYGPCPIHRKSFLKKFYAAQSQASMF